MSRTDSQKQQSETRKHHESADQPVIPKQLAMRTDSRELQILSQTDPQLGKLIAMIGDLTIELRDNYFESLVRSVIGQQLSVKAASTIWNRTRELCGEITPDKILATSDDLFRSAGLSKAKVAYVKDLSGKVRSGELALLTLHHLANDDVIAALKQVKGIGQWTAEMFLIFSLGRLDILSLGDAGLQRAAVWLYGQEAGQTGVDLAHIGQQWAPNRTIGSLYLWEAINRGYVDGKS